MGIIEQHFSIKSTVFEILDIFEIFLKILYKKKLNEFFESACIFHELYHFSISYPKFSSFHTVVFVWWVYQNSPYFQKGRRHIRRVEDRCLSHITNIGKNSNRKLLNGIPSLFDMRWTHDRLNNIYKQIRNMPPSFFYIDFFLIFRKMSNISWTVGPIEKSSSIRPMLFFNLLLYNCNLISLS